MRVALEHPDQPEIRRLVDELDAYQRPLYAAESHHGMTVDTLLDRDLIFAVTRDNEDIAVGCAAAVLTAEYGELKSMFVRSNYRRLGVGKMLLGFLEGEIAKRGRSLVLLETGVKQQAAIRLYERAGYSQCEPFGTYENDPLSVFMRKELCQRGPAEKRE